MWKSEVHLQTLMEREEIVLHDLEFLWVFFQLKNGTICENYLRAEDTKFGYVGYFKKRLRRKIEEVLSRKESCYSPNRLPKTKGLPRFCLAFLVPLSGNRLQPRFMVRKVRRHWRAQGPKNLVAVLPAEIQITDIKMKTNSTRCHFCDI